MIENTDITLIHKPGYQCLKNMPICHEILFVGNLPQRKGKE